MRLLTRNLLLGLGLLAPPLIAELSAAARGLPPIVGIDVVLYWPFHSALIMLAVASFLAVNMRGMWSKPHGPIPGALAGLFASATWFGVALPLVFGLHVSLGGRL